MYAFKNFTKESIQFNILMSWKRKTRRTFCTNTHTSFMRVLLAGKVLRLRISMMSIQSQINSENDKREKSLQILLQVLSLSDCIYNTYKKADIMIKLRCS